MGDISVGPIEGSVFLAVFVMLAIAVLKPVHRSRWRPRSRSRPSEFDRLVARPGTMQRSMPVVVPSAPPGTATDPTEQLRAVMEAPFTAKHVLSRTEANVLRAAEAAIAEAKLPWRVMAQVALGEVLSSTDEAAFRAINAKRVDLLVVSAKHRPLAAIEYQGQGHWQGSAPARDAVKKEALRRAGIGYIEITHTDGPADVRHAIGRLAMQTEAAAASRRLAARAAGA